MANSFNYNQLNIVGRNRSSIEFIQRALLNELENLKKDVSTSGTAFKNVVNVANEVWEGDDKQQFIKNLTASANEFTANIDVMIANIKKYIPQDLADFDALQSETTAIANKKY